jgi:hypothetical protein
MIKEEYMSDPKPIVQVVKEKVLSAVDAANKATVDFLKSTVIPAHVQAGPQSTQPKTAGEARRKQGEGFYQSDIGD